MFDRLASSCVKGSSDDLRSIFVTSTSTDSVRERCGARRSSRRTRRSGGRITAPSVPTGT